MNTLNQERLITLRLQRGLAVRQLARNSGIEIAVLNRLETSKNPTLSNISAAALARLANELHVPVGHLFTTEPVEHTTPTTTAPNDPQELGALLNALSSDAPITVITDALGWDAARTHAAANTLDTLLHPAGMTVYRRSGYVSVRPIDDTHLAAETAVRRHPRARKRQRLVTPARSRLLYKAARKPISQHSISDETRTNILVLRAAGLLIEDTDRNYVPSPDVLLSLAPPDTRP